MVDTAKDAVGNITFFSLTLELSGYKFDNESRNPETDLRLSNNGTHQDETTEIEESQTSQAIYDCQLYRFIMSVEVTGSLCVSGIVGNILTLLVFRKFSAGSSDKRTRSSAPLLLSALAISDCSLLFSLFILKSIPSFISFTKVYPKFFVSYLFYFLMIYGWNIVDVTQCINTWITVLVTMYRFIAIVSPHKAAIHCTYRKARLHLLMSCILAIFFEVPIFFDYEIGTIRSSTSETIYVAAHRPQAHNYWYQLIYKTTLYYVIMYIIPWFILAVMTVFLVKAVKQAQHFRSQMGNNINQQDNTDDITTSLVAVVITSLVCRPWEPVRRVFVAINKGARGCGHYYFYFEEFPSLTVSVNSSANFVLYCLFLKRFPQTLKEVSMTKKTKLNIHSAATTSEIIPPSRVDAEGSQWYFTLLYTRLMFSSIEQ